MMRLALMSLAVEVIPIGIVILREAFYILTGRPFRYDDRVFEVCYAVGMVGAFAGLVFIFIGMFLDVPI